ncbi:MAG: RNA pseudouridine synthase [Bacteroidetes bacterium]|jgi:23S rRNA pseudouridine1911/1915/1917 synthase|nr:RNA pseudouridine synthase [Bacteroidota bacterium]MDA0972800.1 RNA pseudouridine synthase [Bacteroidota bacterium]
MNRTETYKDLVILYEDNHLIAVNKRPGDIVQGDKTQDSSLMDLLKEYIKVKYKKPGDVFIGLVHRLDRPVSGVVVFARTSKALSRMNELFRHGEVKKTYWAVVKNRPQMEEDTLVHHLRKNEKQNKSFLSKAGNTDSKKAELYYQLIGSTDRYWLLEVDLKTGRHHQIRAQLAAIGSPIRGDLKYGSERSNRDGSIHLHGRSITFEHPVKKTPLTILAPSPKESLWSAIVPIE